MWLIADVMSSAVIPLCSGAALYFVTGAFIALVHYAVFCVYMMLLALFFGVRCQLAALSTVCLQHFYANACVVSILQIPCVGGHFIY